MKVQCAVCSRTTSNAKCCSRKCAAVLWATAGAAKAKSDAGKLRPQTQAKMHKCERNECDIITRNNRFCSRSCSNMAEPRRKRVESTTSESTVASEKRKLALEGANRNANSWCFEKNKIASCGNCFQSCKAKSRFKLRIKEALEIGTVPSSYQLCKKMIAEVRGFKCEMIDCLISEWKNQPVLLILDHIDGNSNNHSWSNLRTVCSNCDAQLPTYKARNKKSARAYRRERYAQGLTY